MTGEMRTGQQAPSRSPGQFRRTELRMAAEACLPRGGMSSWGRVSAWPAQPSGEAEPADGRGQQLAVSLLRSARRCQSWVLDSSPWKRRICWRSSSGGGLYLAQTTAPIISTTSSNSSSSTRPPGLPGRRPSSFNSQP